MYYAEDSKMKVYLCNDFSGHYPVGSAAVICAKDKDESIKILEAELYSIGLTQKITPDMLNVFNTLRAGCEILVDGDY